MQKSQEPGTIEMMQTHLLKVVLDAQDGLYLHEHNYKTQDTAVGPSGVHHLVTPPKDTGLVQSTILILRVTCTLLTVTTRATALSRILRVFVPSGV